MPDTKNQRGILGFRLTALERKALREKGQRGSIAPQAVARAQEFAEKFGERPASASAPASQPSAPPPASSSSGSTPTTPRLTVPTRKAVLAGYCLAVLIACTWVPWYVGPVPPDDRYVSLPHAFLWEGPSAVEIERAVGRSGPVVGRRGPYDNLYQRYLNAARPDVRKITLELIALTALFGFLLVAVPPLVEASRRWSRKAQIGVAWFVASALLILGGEAARLVSVCSFLALLGYAILAGGLGSTTQKT